MGVETPGSQSSLHRANLERVVRAVRMAGSLTQAEIARATGLSAATVSNIVRELKDGGTVEVTPTSSGGRRARSVSLSGDAGIVVGVDFGHTHLRVAVGNLAHRVLAEDAEPLDVDASAAQGLDRAEHLVKRLIKEAGINPAKIVGVGLGVPGPIDVASGTLGSTAILPGWAGTNPRDDLAARIGVPVYVDNDANLGALGELVWGAGRGATDLAYIKVASGVGAGLVINGQIYRGPGGTAGEIGHITLDEAGPVCRCGNRGCLETFTAARYVLPLLHSAHGTDLTVARMVELARGRPGLPTGDRGRRPAHRQRRGQPLQPPQPQPCRARRRSRGLRRAGARTDPGIRLAVRDPQRRTAVGGRARRAGRPGRGAGRAGARPERDGRFDAAGRFPAGGRPGAVLTAVSVFRRHAAHVS